MDQITGWTADPTYPEGEHETHIIEEGVVCSCGWSAKVPDLTAAAEAAEYHFATTLQAIPVEMRGPVAL